MSGPPEPSLRAHAILVEDRAQLGTARGQLLVGLLACDATGSSGGKMPAAEVVRENCIIGFSNGS